MKSITFVIHCETYLDAAQVEEFCKSNALKYEERVNTGSEVKVETNTPARPRASKKPGFRRNRVDAEVYSRIKNYIKMHPNWSDAKLKEHYDIIHSENTIWRIRSGQYDEKFLGEHRIRRVK